MFRRLKDCSPPAREKTSNEMVSGLTTVIFVVISRIIYGRNCHGVGLVCYMHSICVGMGLSPNMSVFLGEKAIRKDHI